VSPPDEWSKKRLKTRFFAYSQPGRPASGNPEKKRLRPKNRKKAARFMLPAWSLRR
jgi:hypothetical protein